MKEAIEDHRGSRKTRPRNVYGECISDSDRDFDINLWTDNPIMIEKRDKFQKDYLDKEYAKSIYKKEWEKITNDGTYEKIINYYEDY